MNWEKKTRASEKGCNGLQTRNAGRAGAQPYHVTRAATRPLSQGHRLILFLNPGGFFARNAAYTIHVAALVQDYFM